MSGSSESQTGIATLRSYAGRAVRVRLNDGSEYAGMLRTDLLSERSIAVFIAGDGAEGTTLYLHDIARVWPIS